MMARRGALGLLGSLASLAVAGCDPFVRSASYRFRMTVETETPQGALGNIHFRKEDHGFAGDLTYIRFGRDDKNANGWSVFETAQLPGAEFLEPATPGKKLN